MPPTRKPFAERFWPKVQKSDTGCWPWMAGTTHDGYGFLGAGGRGGGHVYAHRYAYESLVGPIPEGMQLDHLCHNPKECAGGDNCPHRRCVNPAHLEPVTPRMNARRTTTAQKTHCDNGHRYTAETTRIAKNGTRACIPCGYHGRTDPPRCQRCGSPINRVWSGWRHTANAHTGGRHCGQKPLPPADCHPVLSAQPDAQSGSLAAITPVTEPGVAA